MRKDFLNGEWTLKDAKTGETYEAKVPGTNYGDLLRAGKIPDPFDKTNEKETHWVGERDWVYSRTFDVSNEVLSSDFQELCFDMLDTIATVVLNGETVIRADNMHRAWIADVKGKLKKEGNEIVVTFRSPVAYVKEKQAADKMPNNMNGVTGVPHIRKAQCHFGWDWGPVIPVSGIVKDVYIRYADKARITKFEVSQTLKDGAATVAVLAETEGLKDFIRFTLTSPSGKVVTAEAEDGKTEFIVENPELWWTADLSEKKEQPLYTVTAESVSDGIATDSAVKKIGLRTIELDRRQDEYGEQFRFLLNGVPLFIKGANWIPADSFPERVTEKDYDYYLKTMRDSNQNMVRVWGGGYYESEAFYDLTDRYGILVWQDLCFACAPYPFYDEAFLKNVEAEIEENVYRLKHRASLALWCGNNEIEAMTAGWALMRKLVDWSKKFFWEILPVWMKRFDADGAFVQGSPIGTGFLKNLGADGYGDTHMWQVWHGLKPLTYYRTRSTRFCSEFGLESLPDIRTIRGFAEEKDYSLKSPVFMAHQKCMSGNMKMLFYTSTRFRVPTAFEDLAFFTQIIQEECVRDATEHFRRNRGKCNGAMYWQLNDCWPVSSWSSIDYRKRYKVLQYKSKEFNAPVVLSLEETKDSAAVWLLNDKPEAFDGEATYRLVSFDGEEIVAGRVRASANGAESKKLFELSVSKYRRKYKKRIVLEVSLYAKDGAFIAKRDTLFAAEKDVKLPNPEISVEKTVDGNRVVLSLTAKRFARYVRIDSPHGYLPYSDNAFDLMPAETKTVTATVPDGMDAEAYAESLSIRSVYDVKPKGAKWKDALMRLKIRLVPINIANWIYYSFT